MLGYYFALFSLLWTTAIHQIVGTASVINGDTIEIRGGRIRLHGIDAPESSQLCTLPSGQKVRCGQQAALKLDSLLNNKTCRCRVKDTDRYGRQIAVCFVDGIDINQWLVEHGWAMAYQKYSLDYVAAERTAQASQIGIWSYEFERPWNYRSSKRNNNSSGNSLSGRRSVATTTSVTSPTSQVASDCLIKGNINSRGERIYHPLSSPWYSRTKINESKGERWFCSEEEAR